MCDCIRYPQGGLGVGVNGCILFRAFRAASLISFAMSYFNPNFVWAFVLCCKWPLSKAVYVQ